MIKMSRPWRTSLKTFSYYDFHHDNDWSRCKDLNDFLLFKVIFKMLMGGGH
jgi:hypothetical protein